MHDQCNYYSRFDFVGESLSQDESDGGEDRHGGAHGADHSDLQPLGVLVVYSTKTSPIERLEW